MKHKLHYFNPGHETAVQKGYVNYTPPANIQRMIRDLSYLPLWYADSEDYVLVDDVDTSHFLSSLPNKFSSLATPVSSNDLTTKAALLPSFVADPWGLSPQSIRMYEDLVKAYSLSIDIPEWNPIYVELTGRQTAAVCLKRIGELLPEINIPASPVFFTNMEDIEAYLSENAGSYVVKAPYSSSGRGLVWLKENRLDEKDKNCVRGILNKQGCASLELWLDKVQDLAVEFYSDGNGNITYEGLSVFDTAQRGAYSGNILKSQEILKTEIQSKIGKDIYEQVIAAVQQTLKEQYSSHYCGYLGVDMILYKDQAGSVSIHPCIEINMRYTMGMVAVTIFEKHIHPLATGIYTVTYDNHSGEAYQKHQEMKEAYPLTFQDERLRTGYLSLCPVTPETHYRAYILLT